MRINGITWIHFRHDGVVMERCEKKARVLGVGEWFIPGGKLEGQEDEYAALKREFCEEWPTMWLEWDIALPIVEGSAVPPGPKGIFLMRPFVVGASGDFPHESAEGTPLTVVPIWAALESPVVQVRMMVAAALPYREMR